MGKPRKDSWKKLGLAMAAAAYGRGNAVGIYLADVKRLVLRARALRKGANRGKA